MYNLCIMHNIIIQSTLSYLCVIKDIIDTTDTRVYFSIEYFQPDVDNLILTSLTWEFPDGYCMCGL